MKRLLPLLVLLVIWALPVVPAVSAQTSTSQEATTVAPIARDDTVSTLVNTPVDIDVLANDEETTQAGLCLESDLDELPEHGTADVERNQTSINCADDFISYVPDTDFVGKDSLRYAVSSPSGSDDEAWVYIFVSNPPEAQPDEFGVTPGQTTRLDVLANDTDPDDDDLSLESIVVAPEEGTATIVTTGSGMQAIDYTPGSGFAGADSLRYVLIDAAGLRDSAWVNLIINTAPAAQDDDVTTLPDTAIDIDVLANDTDAEDDPLTVDAISEAPDEGTAVITGNVVRYTPDAGFRGTDTFEYAVSDDAGGEATATVTITVNTPPDAEDDTAATLVDMGVTIDVLANDDDPDNHPITLDAIVTAPEGGAAVISNGRIQYTPDEDYRGPDSLRYAISDNLGGTDSAWVFIDVAAEAMLQIIHNGLDVGPVDIYVNDVRLADDFDFREATSSMTFDAGEVTIDLTGSGSTSNDNPLLSLTATLQPNTAYVAVVNGVEDENLSIVLEEVRSMSQDPAEVDVLILHGIPDAGLLDVRVLSDDPGHEVTDVLADNLNFGEFNDYRDLDTEGYNMALTSFDGATVYDVFRFNFSGQAGETFVLVASGRLSGDPAPVLFVVDADGEVATGDIVTATDDETELPTAFALDGNYPNPFNPSTTIQFDLPATAEVTVEIVDVLGRQVMTLPKQVVTAGANRTVEVNASRLASGTYLYRIVAQTATETMTRTGRMTLVK